MKILFVIIVAGLALLPMSVALANPGEGGSTGLIHVPSADTLDAGNICLGVWTDFSENSNLSQKQALTMPVSITLGIGSFWEIYGAYPNILFNNEEEASGHGTLDIGTKLRFFGFKRDSLFKVAADFLAQRRVSENLAIDGVTDISSRLIASFATEKFGLHAYGGYLFPGTIPGVYRDNEVLFGAGVEYMPLARLKLLGEFTGSTNHYPTDELSMEASAGVQYYLSPHLTLNMSAGAGLGKNDPELRIVGGLSSCQGVGTYVKPIPSVGKKARQDKPKEALKPLKIIPISTLLLKASAPQATPVSKLEVEVDADKEDVIIKPYGQITIAPQQASSNLTSPVIPVEIPLKSREEEVALRPDTKPLREARVADPGVATGQTPLYGIDVKGAQVAIPTPLALPERMSLYRKFIFADGGINFDQWSVSSEGRKMLSEIAEQLRKDKKWLYLRIDGHTDSIGSVAYNMDLSLKRAISVASYLISNEGIDAGKIFIKGLGKTVPLEDNGTAEGRSRNRRTEILLLVNKEGR